MSPPLPEYALLRQNPRSNHLHEAFRRILLEYIVSPTKVDPDMAGGTGGCDPVTISSRRGTHGKLMCHWWILKLLARNSMFIHHASSFRVRLFKATGQWVSRPSKLLSEVLRNDTELLLPVQLNQMVAANSKDLLALSCKCDPSHSEGPR